MLFFLCVIFNLIFIFICRVWKPSLSGYWSETQLLSGTLPPSKRVKGYDQQEMWHIPHQDYCIRQFQCRDCCIWWFQHSKQENLSELKKKSVTFSGWDRIKWDKWDTDIAFNPLKLQFPDSNPPNWYPYSYSYPMVRRQCGGVFRALDFQFRGPDLRSCRVR